MFRNWAFIFILIVTACADQIQEDERQVIARVHNQVLYKDQIAGMIPRNATPSDSISIVRTYVRKWIEQQVILNKALKNLTEEELDFSEQLEEYRNSLIIFKYESQLVKEYLDTNVSSVQVQEYYNKYQGNFILKENIVKVNFIMINEDAPEITQFKSAIRSEDPEGLEALEDLCLEYNAEYVLDDSWVYFSDLASRIPYEIENNEDYLRRHRDIQFQENGYWYLLHIKEYSLTGEISPLMLEQENIRNIILNNRKLDLKKRIRIDLIEGAIEKNEVEFY